MLHTQPAALLDSAVALTRERERIALRDSLLRTLSEVLQGAVVRILPQVEAADHDYPSDAANDAGLHRLPLANGEEVLLAWLPNNDAEELRIVQSFVRLYDNFLTIIDESERDRLTQLRNRRAFDAALERITRRGAIPQDGARTHGQHWLALLDLDHFKSINDRFGHLYGDEVLILVARLLMRHFRDSDAGFRYGGEEFAVILNACARVEAESALNRFREAVAEHRFPGIGTVTVSIGFCAIDAGVAPPVIIERADRALYAAKDSGRNRVVEYAHLVGGSADDRRRAVGEIELF